MISVLAARHDDDDDDGLKISEVQVHRLKESYQEDLCYIAIHEYAKCTWDVHNIYT